MKKYVGKVAISWFELIFPRFQDSFEILSRRGDISPVKWRMAVAVALNGPRALIWSMMGRLSFGCVCVTCNKVGWMCVGDTRRLNDDGWAASGKRPRRARFALDINFNEWRTSQTYYQPCFTGGKLATRTLVFLFVWKQSKTHMSDFSLLPTLPSNWKFRRKKKFFNNVSRIWAISDPPPPPC